MQNNKTHHAIYENNVGGLITAISSSKLSGYNCSNSFCGTLNYRHGVSKSSVAILH